MGLLDVFRPRWKHSNPAVRLEAIKTLDDDEALAQAASHDADERVRRLAIRQLLDPWRLKNVASVQSDDKLKAAALGRARELFVEIALSNKETEASALAAVRDLDSQDHLLDIALKASRPAVRTQALDLVVGKSALVTLIKKTNDPALRKGCLARLKDEGALKHLAIAERDLAFGKLILERLKDERDLAEVAQKARNKQLAKLARQLVGGPDTAVQPTASAAAKEDGLEARRRHARQYQLAREAEALADRAKHGAPDDAATAQQMETEWSRIGADADIAVKVRFERALQRFAKLHGAAQEARAQAEHKEAAHRAAAKARELADRMTAPTPTEATQQAAEPRKTTAGEGEQDAVGASPAQTAEAAEGRADKRRAPLAGEALAAEREALLALREQLTQALTSDSLRVLDGAVRQARIAEKRLARLPDEDRDALAAAFSEARGALIKKLSDAEQREAWKRWANVQRFEALCQQAEVLREVIVDFPDKEQAPKELANLRSQWRKLGPVPASKRNELWIRFKNACDAVMDIVEAHRAAQAGEQRPNVEGAPAPAVPEAATPPATEPEEATVPVASLADAMAAQTAANAAAEERVAPSDATASANNDEATVVMPDVAVSVAAMNDDEQTVVDGGPAAEERGNQGERRGDEGERTP